MEIYSKQINIVIGNNKHKINYSYNNYTTYQDLLEYVYSLFPNYNLCPCFIFANKFNYYINSSTLLRETNDINNDLRIMNNSYLNKCACNNDDIKLYKKTKREIIEEFKKIKDYEKKINYLEIQTKINGESIAKLEGEKSGLIQENSYLKNEINNLKRKISDLENKNNNLKYEAMIKIKNLEKEWKGEIDKLQKDKKALELAVNGDLDSINNLKKFGVELNFQRQGNPIEIKPETNEIIGNNSNIKVDFKDFYDVIINIKSIKDINKGWEIKMSDKGLENYRKHMQDKIIKIGVIGNSNKGKSFLLSKISKIPLPSGTSIRTEGLSVKYPDLDLFVDRKIALLDSAGLETPVLKCQEDNNENINVKEFFKEKSREKLITELFLQNYIIDTSDILIIVVGILTYSEQKLLNRIKTEIQRTKMKKPLFIIHNLITYTTVPQVEEYIKKYLFESATFDLEKGHKISTKANKENEKGIYFFEKKSDPKIYHLIFANAFSEAGAFYNQYTLDFLEKSFITVTDLKPYDVIQSVKDRFIALSNEIIEYKDKQKKLSINDFANVENLAMIKLNDEHEITLKKCLIDELGFSNLKGNEFEPTCNYYKFNDNGQEKLEIRVEVPGNSTIIPKLDYVGEYTIVKLKGNKKPDKFPNPEQNIRNTREFGEFSLEIPFKTEDYLIKNEKPEIKEKKGLLIIQYLLDKKPEQEIEFETKDEV